MRQALQVAAGKLMLPADECVAALNLAEALRISDEARTLPSPYPPSLYEFALPLKKVKPLPVGRGKVGTTMPVYSPTEKLMLLALYQVFTLPSAVGVQFARISSRSEASAKDALGRLQGQLSKKGN